MAPSRVADVERLLRGLAPQVLGAVTRRFRDFEASEDAVQEALLAAATQWPNEGVPDEPRAWLIRVAARRMADHVRAEVARRRREQYVVSLVPAEDQLVLGVDEEGVTERDDTLALVFMCCHPALSTASAIALTLRAVAGLTTAEIAKAFLVPEATMAQRISRAKQAIKEAGAAFEVPSAEEVRQRLGMVLHVVYLIFNEGYTTSAGSSLHRTDLSSEAIRLARMLRGIAPDEPEVAGLLALMLLTDARRAARTGPDGEIIPLDEQDRTLWDQRAIAEGVALLEATLPRGTLGPYQVQAAIAACHDEAKSAEETDWAQILALYDLLMRMSESPIVALNHAVAVAMVHGAAAGLERLDAVAADPRLQGHHRVDAVRGHLLERAGDHDSAIACYARAAERTASVPEQAYLRMRAARLRDRERDR